MLKRVINKIVLVTSTYYVKVFFKIDSSTGTKFNKIPYYKKHLKANIKIGKNTVINSSNNGYHVNMFSKCKLYADKQNSEIIIGSNCRIHGTCIHAFKRISIGDNCLIAANTQIIDANGHQNCFDDPEQRLIRKDEGREIIIENNVWIGVGCIILGGSKIGSGTIVAAGSVVRGELDSNSVYSGNPIKKIKSF